MTTTTGPTTTTTDDDVTTTTEAATRPRPQRPPATARRPLPPAEADRTTTTGPPGGGSCSCCSPPRSSGSSSGGGRSPGRRGPEQATLLADEIDAAGASVLMGPDAHRRALDHRARHEQRGAGPGRDLLDHAPSTAARQAVSEAVEALRQAEVQAERRAGWHRRRRRPAPAPPSWPRRSNASERRRDPAAAPARPDRSTYAAGVPAEIQPSSSRGRRLRRTAAGRRLEPPVGPGALRGGAAGARQPRARTGPPARRRAPPVQQGAREAWARALAQPRRRWRRCRTMRPSSTSCGSPSSSTVSATSLAAWADDRTGHAPTTRWMPRLPPPRSVSTSSACRASSRRRDGRDAAC